MFKQSFQCANKMERLENVDPANVEHWEYEDPPDIKDWEMQTRPKIISHSLQISQFFTDFASTMLF